MASQKQRKAAKQNVQKAQEAAKKKGTLKKLNKKTQTALGKESAAVQRGDAPTRKELEEEARKLNIQGRSKMGKAELKRAVANAK
jgi:phage host-nuclease inhibitor protein Gam